MKIAIDGPSGAGKSTIAKALSMKLNFVYIDTGAMYRAIGLFALNNGINIDNSCNDISSYLNEINIELKYIEDSQHIFLNGVDVSHLIRSPEVSAAASKVGTIGCVRSKLVELQRKISNSLNVIMDGRDIGTNVLPDAEIKIFLTANAEVRALRRYNELLEKGNDCNLDEVLRDMIARDKNDSERAISPLKAAEDAILVDTSSMTLNEVIQAIYKIITENIK